MYIQPTNNDPFFSSRGHNEKEVKKNHISCVKKCRPTIFSLLQMYLRHYVNEAVRSSPQCAFNMSINYHRLQFMYLTKGRSKKYSKDRKCTIQPQTLDQPKLLIIIGLNDLTSCDLFFRPKILSNSITSTKLTRRK